MSNRVKRSEVVVDFETASGYSSNETFGTSETNGSAALRDGLREIVRVLAINGESQTALSIVRETIAAVERDLNQPTTTG